MLPLNDLSDVPAHMGPKQLSIFTRNGNQAVPTDPARALPAWVWVDLSVPQVGQVCEEGGSGLSRSDGSLNNTAH